MICKMLRHVNPVRVRNLLFTSAVIWLAIFVSACALVPAENTSSVVLREAEHKTIKHPEKKYYASVWPDGLRVSFNTAQGHFGDYTFPTEEFPVGEPVFLSCPGSPELLPMRVVRLKEAGDYVDYKIEWLAKSPTKSDGARKVVRSY